MRPVRDQFRDALGRRYSRPDQRKREREREIARARARVIGFSSGEDRWSPNLYPTHADMVDTR